MNSVSSFVRTLFESAKFTLCEPKSHWHSSPYSVCTNQYRETKFSDIRRLERSFHLHNSVEVVFSNHPMSRRSRESMLIRRGNRPDKRPIRCDDPIPCSVADGSMSMWKRVRKSVVFRSEMFQLRYSWQSIRLTWIFYDWKRCRCDIPFRFGIHCREKWMLKIWCLNGCGCATNLPKNWKDIFVQLIQLDLNAMWW